MQIMQKAVRWAIGSSLQTTKPSLTIFLLPFDSEPGSAYQQWLGHSAVSKIACIPKKAFRLQMPDAWQTGVPFSRHAKEDMLPFSVGNSQGFSTFVNLAPLEQGLQRYMRRARMYRMTFAYTLPCLSNQLQVSTLPFSAPHGCTDDIPDTEDGSSECSNEPLPANCLVPKPLKWQADRFDIKPSTQTAAYGTAGNQVTTEVAQRSTGQPQTLAQAFSCASIPLRDNMGSATRSKGLRLLVYTRPFLLPIAITKGS